MSPQIVTVGFVAIAVTIGWLAWNSDDGPDRHGPATEPRSTEPVEPFSPPPASELVYIGPAPEPVGAEDPGMVCPDGTTLPPLNGVDQRVRMQWHTDGPYAPVIAKLIHNGQEYYRHDDGTLTSVIHVINEATGQPNIMSQVWSQGEVRPLRIRR